jgi:hypothetical protein
MRGAFRHKPSAPMIVAILALVVAASGTAVAATQLAPGDQLIKKHSLSGNRLRNGTITGKEVNVATLGKVPSATNAGHASNADHATNADKATSATTAGSAAISQLVYESTTVTLSSSGPAAGAVACPAGLDVVAGGAHVSNESNDLVNDSGPIGRTGWQAAGFGGDGDTMIVSAICAPAATTGP